MTSEKISRRRFLRNASLTGAGAAAATTLAAPAVLAQAPLTIKMQTSWPSSDIWMDFAREYTTRVEEMSGGRVKFDLLPAGAVVGAFQVMDAVNDGVLDAAHTVPVYCTARARPRRSSEPDPCSAGRPPPCSVGSTRAAVRTFTVS